MVLLKKEIDRGNLDNGDTFIVMNYSGKENTIGRMWSIYPNGTVRWGRKQYWQEDNNHGALILLLYDHGSGRHLLHEYKFKKFSQGRQENTVRNENNIIITYNLNFDEDNP